MNYKNLSEDYNTNQQNKQKLPSPKFDTIEQAFEAAEKRRKQILKKSAITPERLYRQFTI